MVSYTSSSYTTDFFDLSGVYFNSTTQSSGSSSVDLDELDCSAFGPCEALAGQELLPRPQSGSE